jgi:acyl-CoA thioesterase
MADLPIPREDLSFLDVKRAGEGAYLASLEDFFGEAQPGDLLARIALAAGELAGGGALRSLHASFLAPAPPAVPLTLAAARLGGDLRRAAFVFLCAFYPHWEFERRVGARFDHARFALLDVSLRIHGAAESRDWCLLRGVSAFAAGGVAHARRGVFARNGRLLASCELRARVAESS